MEMERDKRGELGVEGAGEGWREEERIEVVEAGRGEPA